MQAVEQRQFTFRNAGRAAGAGLSGEAAGCLSAPGAPGGTAAVRDTWISWLAPVFAGNESAYITGTYSDEYGVPHGCMAVRNVQKDWRRFLDSLGLETRRFIVGVEKHAFRDVLHLHGILEGPFTEDQRGVLKAAWSLERGFARVLPVQDGCASYVTKYALKGDTEAFEWRLS